MGIMTVRDASEVTGLNRKQRNKMAVVKEGLEVSSVIVQEGVPTFESIHDAIAEPVVYMIDRFVVGGFYRVHAARGKDENLNAPGAQFVPLAFEVAVHSRPCGARRAARPTASTRTASSPGSRSSPRRSKSRSSRSPRKPFPR